MYSSIICLIREKTNCNLSLIGYSCKGKKLRLRPLDQLVLLTIPLGLSAKYEWSDVSVSVVAANPVVKAVQQNSGRGYKPNKRDASDPKLNESMNGTEVKFDPKNPERPFTAYPVD